MRSLLHQIFDKMSENLSFCALEDGTCELVGVLVASMFDKSRWKFALEYPGDGLRQIMIMRDYAITKAMFYEIMGAEKPVRIDILCVRSDHQRKGIATALLRSCLARISGFASVCVGEFTSGASQTIAQRLQFEVLCELPYESMEAEGHRYQIFKDCYPENYSIACMAVKILPPPPRYQPSIKSVSLHTQKPKKRKKTRKKK
ncbi:uncharacterized protein LOC114872024 isoform X1 [Osmia bicornis bicornis]|uniref:uncharacterized protein LOC114872024 isoform X1 n=1 Tax=Osmia bicornis bicornis TaxID=1437191 RepID=UPI0010FA40DF|nr:uncharacterized protein LOC114872024 isoform X1 [Osmia bicornis bicornis]